MINNLNGLKNIYTIDKFQLPECKFLPFEETQFSPNDKNHFIIANKESNKAELQEAVKVLSESNKPIASFFWGLDDLLYDDCDGWF